jgi:DNA repair exonuclease SbcCD ATPase subunit
VARGGKKDSPPYAKYAFLNPYNLSLLAGAGAAALTTGFWPLAVVAGAAEAIWMLFAPDSRFLQRIWFDKTWELENAEQRAKIRDQKLSLLSEGGRSRWKELRAQQQRIEKLAGENPSFTGQLLRKELDRLGDLADDFLDVSGVCARYEQHLGTIDNAELDQEVKRYQKLVGKLPEGDERHAIAQKNLDVMLARLERARELHKNLQAARGQLDLMENTFQLLADEIVSMSNPNEVGARLEDLRSGVEAVRETSRETELNG